MEDPKQRLLRAASAIYLLFPVLLFAWGWLRPPYMILTILLITVFFAHAIRDIIYAIRVLKLQPKASPSQHRFRQKSLWIGAAFLLITIWLLFSGIGGFGFQNTDYWASNSLLKDLISQDWPLSGTMDGNPIPIVYYVGYYLPAAMVGKFLGWVPANVAIFLWSLMGISLAFLWFVKLSRVKLTRNPSRILVLALFFCLAGGLDYLGFYVFRDNVFELKKHAEAWAIFFQYSSNTTLIYWVPQHTIAAWLVISITADSLYEIQNVNYLGISVAASILWSPFGIIGATPFFLAVILVYLVPGNRKHLFNRTSILLNSLALGLGGILSFYISSNQFKFPFGILWQLVKDRLRYFKFLGAFWFVEFGFLACLILGIFMVGIYLPHRSSSRTSKSHRQRWKDGLESQFDISPQQFNLFLLSLVGLTLLPLFKMGVNNDLVMRASIPSLFILWTLVIKVVMDSHVRVKLQVELLRVLLLIVVFLGFFPGIAEISRSIKKYQFGPPAISSVLEFEELSTRDIEQRTGDDSSFFYQYLSK